MKDAKARTFSSVCPACGSSQQFQELPRVGRLVHCSTCKSWLKVSRRWPVQLELLRSR